MLRAFLQRKSVRICRVIFRWMRICFLLMALAVVAFVAHLHWNGLPDWLKKPILAHLRDRGLQVQFSRMRLGWGPAIIVDDASFQRESDQPEPRLSAKQAALELTLLDLARAKVAVKAVEVTSASLRFPPAGAAGNSLSLDNIQLTLLFPATNTVRLTNASASFRGVRLTVNGQLDHAEAVRQWKFLRPNRAKTSWQTLLDRLTDTLDQIHFAETPRIVLSFGGDARDLDTLRAHLSLGAPDVSTPWGDARRIRLEAFCRHPFATNQGVLRLTFGADDVATRWAQGSILRLTADFSRDDDFNVTAQSQFSARELDGSWGTNFIRSTGFHWDGAAGLNGTNFHLLRASGNLRVDQAVSGWGRAAKLLAKIDGVVGEPPAGMTADWGFWSKLARYHLRFSGGASAIAAPKLQMESVALEGAWEAPLLSLGQIHARLYDGGLDGDAKIDVSTREVDANAGATFDERRITQLLTPSARHWLAYLDWNIPPKVNASLRLTLPAWTNRHPNWSGSVRDSLRIAGDFSARDGSFRGAPVDRAQGHFGFTNSAWTLPDFRAWRDGGEMGFFYNGSLATHEYHFIIDTAVDPRAAENLLPEAQRHWFNEFAFTTPPKIHADVRGKWKSPELTGVRAEISATNFVAHGEHIDSLVVTGDYTNRFFHVQDARVLKGTEYATIGSAEADLSTKTIRVTNVLASVTPDLLRRACAPRKIKWLEAIQFDRPPAIRLAGSFQIGQPMATDLGFEVAGQGFHFTNIVADSITGGIRWRGRHAALTNIQATVYHTGTLVGTCAFDWDPKLGTEFNCNFNAKDVDLPALARGLTGRPSKLEGMLDGNLIMDRSNARERQTWKGLGEVHVHNALLWDIRIFGLFSPVLNAISPGAGNSRAYEASARYVITNGVVATDDLTIRSTGFRLLYRGSVNIIDKQMNARVEAEPLRDVSVFGPILSALLSPLSKLFEYKVSGNLHDPHSEPVYIPPALMVLLRPFHALKSLGNDNPSTPKSIPPAPASDTTVEPNKK